LSKTHNRAAKNSFWNKRRVLVTGGAGFIGSHLVERLVANGAMVRVVDSLDNGSIESLKIIENSIEWVKGDLMDPKVCAEVCAGEDTVMNLAAKVAGVAYNSKNSAEMFLNNLRIGLNVMEAARLSEADRFLVVSSACVYSRDARVPTPEEDGFVNDPEPSNLGYGWAKRALEVQGRLYAERYGMKVGIVRPFNTYGPRDHFDSESGHVVPSLIKKIDERNGPIVVWGDGRQTRAFVHVSDVVKGMMLVTEKYPVADPVNIGSGEEISIGHLARIIAYRMGSTESMVFDSSKPQGQPRRCPDLSKAKMAIGFEAEVSLEEGLKETVEWYLGRKNKTRIASERSIAQA